MFAGQLIKSVGESPTGSITSDIFCGQYLTTGLVIETDTVCLIIVSRASSNTIFKQFSK